MITFKQFLSEEEMNEVEKLIKTDCGPFLREAKGAGFLRRGIKARTFDNFVTDYAGDDLSYIVKEVRQDRRPADSSPFVHAAMDEWFEKNMGFKARSSTMFAFGEHVRSSVLASYGTSCIVFPIGPIKYAWSPVVRDLYVELPVFPNEEDNEVRKKLIWEKLDAYDYKTTDLNEAISHDPYREIMIQCDKYYAFPIGYKEQLQISLDIFP